MLLERIRDGAFVMVNKLDFIIIKSTLTNYLQIQQTNQVRR